MRSLCLFFLGILVAIGGGALAAPPARSAAPPEAVPHQFVVSLGAKADGDAVCARLRKDKRIVRCEILKGRDALLVEWSGLKSGPDRAGALARASLRHAAQLGIADERHDLLELLQQPPAVDAPCVDYNLVFRLSGVPSDPEYADQWALKRIGAPEAWEHRLVGAREVVAVLDSGVDGANSDLLGNLWRNSKEMFGEDGKDDDGNDVADDFFGANFSTDRATACQPIAGSDATALCDRLGHGTAVASIIGAIRDNGYGLAGVAPDVSLMPVKITGAYTEACNADDCAPLTRVLEAVRYARKSGATVLNLSWGAEFPSCALEEELKLLPKQVVVVAAAGNGGAEIGKQNVFYPASSGLPNVVAVGASSMDDEVIANSNYGALVRLYAPGEDILVWRSTGASPSTESGTSMAVPFVSGALALLRPLAPDWTAPQLIDYLVASGDPIAQPSPRTGTVPRLNLARATSAPVAFDPHVEGVVWDEKLRHLKWSRPFVTERCPKGALQLIDPQDPQHPLYSEAGVDWSGGGKAISLRGLGRHENVRWRATCEDSHLVAWSKPFTVN